VPLADAIGRLLGRAELVLAGAEDDFRDGQEALAHGDAMGARAAAHRVLSRVPGSPLGLALLADACDAGALPAELVVTLEELSERVPSQAEIWARLGRARARSGAPEEPTREAFARSLALASPGSDARHQALVGLADLDLAHGRAERAELWLDREPANRSVDLLVRRAEARMQRGDPRGALDAMDGVAGETIDGRWALVRGRALCELGDASAFGPLMRAWVLDEAGADESLSLALVRLPTDPSIRTRLRALVEGKGELGLPRWRGAFLRAEDHAEAARHALSEGARDGDSVAAAALLELALEDRDVDALKVALDGIGPGVHADDGRRILAALRQGEDKDGADRLDAVASMTAGRAATWASSIVDDVVGEWLPADGPEGNLPALVARLTVHARAIGDAESVARLAAMMVERGAPPRLVIVGEFNAGKSTFINALVGADVAAAGILPTTALLFHLRWAPLAFARIVPVAGEAFDRVVAIDALRHALPSTRQAAIDRVELYLPSPALAGLEVVDTPGFNAQDRAHAEFAWQAFREADLAIWIVDATQALKNTERAVLEEAAKARLPVQIVVNKADRLTGHDLGRVMTAVEAGVRDVQLPSWSPPFAVSARKALSGKLEDASAMRDSGWERVDAFLQGRVAEQRAELKDRSLRRRAAAVVATLVREWTARDAAVVEKKRERDRLFAARTLAARSIEQDASQVGAQLTQALTPSVEAWHRDVRLVLSGRDADEALRDPRVERYCVERATAEILPALMHALDAALTRFDAETGVAAETAIFEPTLRGVVRVLALEPRTLDVTLALLARAAIAIVLERLRTVPRDAEDPLPSRAEGVVRELHAMAAALDRRHAAGSMSGRATLATEVNEMRPMK
jgi:GTP-binding protein EngB required for normal cell division